MSALAVGLAGCASGQSADAPDGSAAVSTVRPSPEAALDECSTENLTVVNPGQLTVAVVGPVEEPMFAAGKPANGEGFESALVFSLAEGLGFSRMQVAWLPGTLEQVDDTGALATDSRRADFAVGQITAPPPPGVDFSVPYLIGPGDDDVHALAFVAGNPLRACVDGVLISMAADGQIDDLAATWLVGSPWDEALVGPSVTRVS